MYLGHLRKLLREGKGENTIRIFHWSTLSVCVCVYMCAWICTCDANICDVFEMHTSMNN